MHLSSVRLSPLLLLVVVVVVVVVRGVLSIQTCAAVDVEEHVWDLEEKRGLIGSDDSEDGDAADNSHRTGGGGGRRSRGGSVELSERGDGGFGDLSRRESHEDDASWRGSGSDTASWRGSGSALLSHVALSSSTAVGPSS